MGDKNSAREWEKFELTFRGQLANVIYDLDKEFYCIAVRH